MIQSLCLRGKNKTPVPRRTGARINDCVSEEVVGAGAGEGAGTGVIRQAGSNLRWNQLLCFLGLASGGVGAP